MKRKKRKHPLRKRLWRELVGEFGRYLVIFLFMTGTVGFVSGHMVASGSMLKAYQDSYDKYLTEDGHFLLTEAMAEQTRTQLEEVADIRIYDNFYLEAEADCGMDGETDATIRIYVNRENLNLDCLMKGKMPEAENEIALDRMFADNNEISVGDQIDLNGNILKVCGFVALPDYSALFESNTDMMFDAVKFGVGVVTQEGFSALEDGSLHYAYAFRYGQTPEGRDQEKAMSDELMHTLFATVPLVDYVPAYANQAIRFTADDMGGDRAMMLVLLYILTAILAFVFAVTVNHTITRESAVIGTLRASGYTRGELVRHYLTVPVLVTIVAALFGNLLGYTYFKNLVVAMYYNSYSLPTYRTVMSSEAFLMTTVIPAALMLLINFATLVWKLRLSPQCFLRRDLTVRKNKRALRLPDLPFFHRFRMRVILQNLPGFITLFAGMCFTLVLLMFGLMMMPLLKHFEDDIKTHMLADYQYLLKAPVETEYANAESYRIVSMRYLQNEDDEGVELTVYGIDQNSQYLNEELPDTGVCVSNGFAEKYLFSIGDTLALREAYGTEEFSFRIEGLVEYPAGMAVFMTKEQFETYFAALDGCFYGYFSNTELSDIEESMVLSLITEEELTKLTRQLNVSMGTMFYMLHAFSLILSALLIYLLTRLILERNAEAISMVKILGYENGEIARLYLAANTIVMVFSALAGTAAASAVLKFLFRAILADYSLWLPFYVSPALYVQMIVLTLLIYVVVSVFQYRKVRRIPLEKALKNAE